MSPNQSSFDQQVHQVTILVTAPTPDSSSSIGTGSPTLLIPEHDASSPHSSHGPPTVKFAPLPRIDPHRKRSLAPLGVPARSRRKQIIQREGGSLLWSRDPDEPEESMEDPIISFAKFVKKTGKTLWRRVRKNNKNVPQENEACSGEPVLDIGSTVCSDDMEKGVSRAVELEEKLEIRRASWSPLAAERRTLGRGRARRSTSDLPRQVSVIS